MNDEQFKTLMKWVKGGIGLLALFVVVIAITCSVVIGKVNVMGENGCISRKRLC
jgi:type IV secretory pathway TrbL component